MRPSKRVAAGLLTASLLLPIPISALSMSLMARGATMHHATGDGSIHARQTIPVSRRQLNRHQQLERQQLNLYFRRLRALLRAHQLLERRLLRASHFTVPPPAVPIPTPFPF